MISDKFIQQKQVEDSIKQEFDQTVSARTERYLKVKPHGIVPYTPFAPPSAECSLLFRDGHFYGCIALTQAVAEAVTRFLCQRNSWKPAKKFETNVDKLYTRSFISKKIKERFLKIWDKRDAYHHLNPSVETERKALEEIAYKKILLLKEIEAEIFKFSITADGKLVPHHPRYWDVRNDGTAPVFLRLE